MQYKLELVWQPWKGNRIVYELPTQTQPTSKTNTYVTSKRQN